jgi:hypothetical protein
MYALGNVIVITGIYWCMYNDMLLDPVVNQRFSSASSYDSSAIYSETSDFD